MASDDTRTRFLTSALSLFAEHGYAGTSTRMLASAAQSNVASLAYHFGGKEGLYREALGRLHDDLAGAAPSHLTATQPRGMAEEVVAVAWRFAKDHRDHIRLLLRHILDQGQHDLGVSATFDPLMSRADVLLAAFRPDLTPMQRRLMAMTVMHTVVRLAIEHPDDLAALAGDLEVVDEEIRAFLTDMLCRQLGVA